MEKKGAPGSARFGNFINYYSFNPPDRRTNLIQFEKLLGYLSTVQQGRCNVLDIGCNTGDLTVALYQQLTSSAPTTPCKILGVDIDPVLIERATSSHLSNTDQVKFATCDIMEHCIANNDGKDPVSQFIGESERFDLVCCFSVTLWIHLNNGDAGLKDFLKYVAKKSKLLLLEPQPWKCYKTAVRRMKKLDCKPFEHFKELEWRESVDSEICNFLQEECGMTLCEKFGQTDWERMVCLFKSTL